MAVRDTRAGRGGPAVQRLRLQWRSSRAHGRVTVVPGRDRVTVSGRVGPATAVNAAAGGRMPVAAATATAGPTIPDWVPDAIFYQVFPDRFANGDRSNDPAGTAPWGSAPTNDGFMGGDLIGLTARMDYLRKLGVNALYLNPIFTSPSNHKYNTTDYENVDPALGGNAALTSLVTTAHAGGVKVMLDGVFNHVSHEHPWFKDVRDRGPDSPFWNRFTVNRWPIRYSRDDKGVLRSPDYASWWGYATLPELKTESDVIRNYFLRDRDAIVKRWIRDYHIDGWRMDVADEVEPDFWREARTAIKSTSQGAYLLAENWHDASAYLQGDQFDSVMNYRYFQQPAVRFFAKKNISADEFVASLKSPYPTSARLAAFNLLGSHDTPRFITEAGGDWYRLRPAAIFQMTYVGAPVIYYGDEIGMEGAADPDSRRAFDWAAVERAQPSIGHSPRVRTRYLNSTSHPDERSGTSAQQRTQQLLTLYQTLAATRTAEQSLRRGEFSVLSTHNVNGTVAYRRWMPGNDRDVLVALNNSTVGRRVEIPVGTFAPDGTFWRDALTGRRVEARGGSVTLPDLDGNWGAVLVRETAARQ